MPAKSTLHVTLHALMTGYYDERNCLVCLEQAPFFVIFGKPPDMNYHVTDTNGENIEVNVRVSINVSKCRCNTFSLTARRCYR